MSRIVTKAQAAAILSISPKEVVRRIEKGELKGRKKTASKFSDWLVELPDDPQSIGVEEVKEVLEEPEPDPDEMREEAEEIQAEIDESAKAKPEPELKPLRDRKQVEDLNAMREASRIQTPKKEDKKDARPESKPVGWWYGN